MIFEIYELETSRFIGALTIWSSLVLRSQSIRGSRTFQNDVTICEDCDGMAYVHCHLGTPSNVFRHT